MLAPWTLALLVFLQAPTAPTAQVGSRAPVFQPTRWLRGEEVFALEPGRVHLIVFWAPWSGASTQSFARLSDLAQRQAARGLTVTAVVGPDAHDASPQSAQLRLAELEAFARFRCAWDGDGSLRANWLGAARANRLPTAFLVDRRGHIAAIDAPQRIEGTIPAVLEDRHQVEALARRASEDPQRVRGAVRLRGELQSAWRARDFERALSLCDELHTLDPALHGRLAITRFQLLLRELGRVDEAYAYGRTLLTGPVADDVGILSILAWTVVDPAQALQRRDLEFAGRCAQRAVDLTQRRNATLLDTLARVHAAQGELERAIEIAAEAARLDPLFEHVLAEYRAARR